MSPDTEVLRAQLLLQSLGYDPGPVDGQLGPQTRRAIESFQRDRRPPPDGKISQSLVSALEAAVRENNQKQEAEQHRGTEPRLAAIPQFAWPKWSHIPSKLPSAKSRGELDPTEIYETVKDSVWIVVAGRAAMDFEKLRKLSQGSAIAVSPVHLITNCHVVKERPLIVIVKGEEIREAQLKSADPLSDRCILAVDKPSLSSVTGIRPFSDLKVGERVYSVGAPSGLELTLGEGIISGLRPTKKGLFVQTSAPISPGSSGGGLFDNSGNLVGITTFLLKETQSINFAIAAEEFWH